MRAFLLSLLVLAPPAAFAASPAELVEEALVREAKRRLPESVVDVEVHGLRLGADVHLPEAPTEVRIRAVGSKTWLGKGAFEADLRAGDFEKTVSVTAELTGWTQVAVLSRPVGRGQVLDASALSTVRRPLDEVEAGVLRAADLDGRVAKKDLSLGDPVRERDLEVRVDAPRRAPVRLILQGGALTVSIDAVMQHDGRVGEMVVVRTGDKGMELRGLLATRNTVVVSLQDGVRP